MRTEKTETPKLNVKCFYCEKKATEVAICNDWGNIPLCGGGECRRKFQKENTSQFFVERIQDVDDCEICRRMGFK